MGTLEVNGVAVPSRQTVTDDERLTRGTDGNLAWTKDVDSAPYALTNDDIINETSATGTVSGEQLATLGGSGGPEVLKDWTTVTNLSTDLDLLGGITLPSGGLNNLKVEIEDLVIDDVQFSFTSFLGLVPKRSGKSVSGVTYKARSEHIDSNGVADIGAYSANSALNFLCRSSQGRQRISLEAKLLSAAFRDATVLRESVGVKWEGNILRANTAQNNGSMTSTRGVLNGFGALVDPDPYLFTELWLIPASNGGTYFNIDTFKYRITK